MNALVTIAVGVVVVLAVGAVALLAWLNLTVECRRDEFGRPGRSGSTRARDVSDLAGPGVPDGR
ncbi:hypothetical protein [Saccharothrix lopnurensis]|uniref:Uncharacterized protein n=1 Tax=Saccharothrix lopnurensis TaxID=1670621 RepID=A0ABW1P1M5_9PSEU